MTEFAPSGSRRAAVVWNPSKKFSFDLVALVEEACAETGWQPPLWMETTLEDPGAGQAQQAMEAGVDLVIAAGGDGTVRRVAGRLAGTDTPLGVIPLGTGNLLARNLDLPVDDPETAVRIALAGRERQIDAVLAKVDDSGSGAVFLVMAGLGFDAAVIGGTDDGLKDRIGWLAYVEAGLRNLPGKPVRATLSIDGGKPITLRMRSVMGGNCGKIQGGFEMFPGAQIDDGLLDIMTISPRGRLGWLGVLAGLAKRGRSVDPSVDYYRGKEVEITAGRPQEMQLDGDHIGMGSRLSMRVNPGALRVRVAAD
ncbi:MAG: diacylglycerol/lipid kinase family protein [Actinomycetota bacterium]